MTTTITIGADDFTAIGLVPVASGTWIRFAPMKIDYSGARVQSARTWSVTLNSSGIASTQVPDAVTGNGLLLTSNIRGWEGFWVAGYPTGTLTLTALLRDYQVSEHSFSDEDLPESWWVALDALQTQVDDLIEQGGGGDITHIDGGGA